MGPTADMTNATPSKMQWISMAMSDFGHKNWPNVRLHVHQRHFHLARQARLHWNLLVLATERCGSFRGIGKGLEA